MNIIGVFHQRKYLEMSKGLKYKLEPKYNRLAFYCITWFYLLPIKKSKIVFIRSVGGSYCCNLKYVAEEIMRQGLTYDMVWLVEHLDTKIPTAIRKIKYNRIRAVYELATAHVIINDSKSLYPVKKKQGQVFIYIPHGQPGCKCAEGDAILPTNYIENSKIHSSLTDVFVSMGRYHTQVLKDTFWVPEHAKIWEIGFPRNDQYYQDYTQKQKELRKQLNIPDGTRIVLYAPTFRDNNTIEAYNLNLQRTLSALEQKTGFKWIMFVTLHPNFLWFKKPPYVFNESVWNMSDYPDLHELLLIVNITISDYSSVALDFANLRRPVFLYASDVDEYRKMRGLKEMYFQLPFALCCTNDELHDAIMAYDEESYQHRLDEFQKIYGSVDDGHASERFVNKLKALI